MPDTIKEKSRISRVFDKKALMPYITAGDPNLDLTGEIIKLLDRKGADIIEIGIPFSDPLADGPVIQAAGQRALAAGTSLSGIFQLLRSIKNEIEATYLLMGYYNSILNYGRERFITDAREAGIKGVIIPDLPFDQEPDFYRMLRQNNIYGILMVTPVTSERRLQAIANYGSGFIYCVSLLGTTGDSRGPVLRVGEYLERVRSYTELPLALGFGIDGPEKVKKIIDFVDGVIIGSALVKLINKYNNDPSGLMKEIAKFITDIKKVM